MKDNHTRILQVRLLLIDRCLHNIIRKLDCDTNNSIDILYSFKNTIDHEHRTRILDVINIMFNEIDQMKKKFALESKEILVIKSITGDLDEIWTTLENTRPEKMVIGYGNMSNVDEELLRPFILTLLHLVNNIYTELEEVRSGT
jgi:hypothetical protein